MVLTNEIKFNVNYDKFFEMYDVYYISTSEYKTKLPNFLRKNFKALSIFYTYGKTMYVMYKKGEVSLEDLKIIINDDCVQIGTSGPYDNVILNIALNSLGNFKNEKLAFNNLTGSLYLFDASSTKKTIKAYDISFVVGKNKPYYMNVSVTSFMKYDPKYPSYDLYELTNKGGLKAVLNSKDATGDLYVKKKGGKKKTTSKFYDLSKTLDRATIYHMIMKEFKKKFEGLIDIDFVSYEPIQKYKTLKALSTKKTNERKKALYESINGRVLNVVSNIDLENDKNHEASYYENNIDVFVSKLLKDGFKVDRDKKTSKYPLNIVINHEKDYYDEDDYDPYKDLDRNTAVQCVTIETLIHSFTPDNFGKLHLSSYYVVLKELVIKNDLKYTHRISLDDWVKRELKEDYIFGMFADDKEDKIAYLKVKPDGSIETYYDKKSLFNLDEIERIKLALENDKAKYFIMDSTGHINTISPTEIIVLPTEKVLEEKKKTKDYKEEFMEGIFDIHTYDIEGELYYTSGVKDNIQSNIDKATHFYKVNTYNGRNIFIDLVKTVGVDFVRYGNYTVLPYPFKYLREYVNLIK